MPNADISKPTIFGWPSFFAACLFGRDEVVKLFLERKDINPNEAIANGRTPFFAACLSGSVEVAKILLERKHVDPNIANSSGCTPFFVACQNKHKEIVKLLSINKRIDVNKSPNEKPSPIYYYTFGMMLLEIAFVSLFAVLVSNRLRRSFYYHQ